MPDRVEGQFQIVKHDKADDSVKLAGAQFEVYKAAGEGDENPKIVVCGGVEYAVVPVMSDGSILTLTTGENGVAVSPEMDCGTYFLVETVAPAGYNLAEEAFIVTVVSNEVTKITTVMIPNQAGVLLPETGGSGTAAIMLSGLALIALAAAVLTGKKRAAID